MNVVALTPEIFDTEVLASSQPVVVEFWAEGCKPCQKLGGILRKYADQLKIATCNIDEQPAIGERFGINNIPSLLFFKDGEVIDDAIGTVNDISEEEVRTKVERVLQG